ncbi:Endonuclease/Exonuclease/phosphatase family protein [Trichomonas vaginalis G3]|uniref:Endonuclease/Exonuclease/phosphatase family protein n=1 Tax=Trichomonas vaginalis (strain ATCC PRA-98 / G3) TaxID=412133 RepID=A2FD15_TRIV3|nr:phosphatidylinositol-4,5-bisphosphate 5-phosphatase protein [Trichomonas vaginalis G3]EAX97208.1 Endonuclease/Exonuclease/phosphatase family protein [Trichomonas vaginalis G3]KAI5536197.1 phosphatidylinositol-4,5-bisphosphate 5-phosphatase protein [Trichomonas vaginalis G3]|eukprot:XP_001310138.1 Endonuclease/Exonuclease/phosphatase family protein [Trichomonas vaginalis G3]
MQSNIVINILTWNCASNMPNQEVNHVYETITYNNPDLISFSLEEIAPTPQTTEEGNTVYFNAWSTKISELFGDMNYNLIKSKNVGGVALFLIQNRNSYVNLNAIEESHIFFGGQKTLNNDIMPANKASIKFTSTVVVNNQQRKISFLANHLQAYDEEYLQRNKMWKEIDETTLSDDYTIFSGDLNYRINNKYENVVELTKSNSFGELIAKDQLKQAQRENIELNKYDEADISFLPTYKYDENTNIYDTSSKHRVPSYCDRILIKTQNKRVKPIFLKYNRIESMFSDHRPVYLSVDISFDE